MSIKIVVVKRRRKKRKVVREVRTNDTAEKGRWGK